MDFVISKVAMSVCALLVAGVLSGCLDPANLVELGGDLDDIVRRFCVLVDRIALSGSSSSLTWAVPCLPDGQDIRVEVQRGLVKVEAGDERCYGQPVSGVHTWHNTGAAMNSTGLKLLDAVADGLVAVTGESILLTTELVLLDNEPAYLAFVSKCA